jgi:hypothetical protein
MSRAAAPDTVPTRAELREHLLVSRIAGDVATSRENNLGNFHRMSLREPLYLFGLDPAGEWTADDVLALMADRCGVSPDRNHRYGQDTIDPDRTLDALAGMADRIRLAAERRERVLVATGHPVGLRPTHTAVARALRAAGCTMLTPAAGWSHPGGTDYGHQPGRITHLDDVAGLAGVSGLLHHSHSPLPMRAMLDELADQGQAPPDLVLADHGWAGEAGQRGIDAAGYADCNDPALFVGEAEGRILVTVPLDDNVAPHLYAPLTSYLLDLAGL